MRWSQDIHAPLRAADRLRPAQLVSEHRALVHLSVAVGVGQESDAAPAFGPLILVFLDPLFGEPRVVRHLDDVHPVPLVERGVDRIGDERFARHQFQREAMLQLEGPQRLVG